LHFDRLIGRPRGQLVGFFLADKVDSNSPARAWPTTGADSGSLSAADGLGSESSRLTSESH